MGYEVKVASEKELEPACIFLKQFEKGLAVCMELEMKSMYIISIFYVLLMKMKQLNS